jgi:hypothetical protein
MSSEFKMTSKDYSVVAEIACVNDSDDYPNHGDLRHAIDRLMHSLGNWDHVDITIKTVKPEEV